LPASNLSSFRVIRNSNCQTDLPLSQGFEIQKPFLPSTSQASSKLATSRG
jgi:hypothetical protein